MDDSTLMDTKMQPNNGYEKVFLAWILMDSNAINSKLTVADGFEHGRERCARSNGFWMGSKWMVSKQWVSDGFEVMGSKWMASKPRVRSRWVRNHGFEAAGFEGDGFESDNDYFSSH